MAKTSAPKKSSSTRQSKKTPTELDHEQSPQQPVADEDFSSATRTSLVRTKKREAVISSDSSDAERSTFQIQAKRQRRSPPAPGTPAFEELPAVSITQSQRPRRSIIKSEKAKALEEGQQKRSHARVANVELDGDSDVPPPSSCLPAVEIDNDSDTDLPEISSILKGSNNKQVSGCKTDVRDEEIQDDRCDDSRPLKNKSTSSTSLDCNSRVLGALDKLSSTTAIRPASPEPSIGPTKVKVSGDMRQQSPVGSDASDNPLPVMLTPCPDPDIAWHYEGLPLLPRVCEIKSFSGTSDSFRTLYADMVDIVGRDSEQIISKALRFTRCEPYINTARINPALLEISSNPSRLRIIEPSTMAYCIMTGTVTESFLATPFETGSLYSPYRIHKVSIAPFEQDFRRDTAVWGLLFNFKVIPGMISPSGFGFGTRSEGRGDTGRFSSTPSPVKGKSPVKKKSRGLKMVSSSLATGSLEMSSRSFDDQIPVYDGRRTANRRGFRFKEADFKGLSTCPLYEGAEGELPLGSIVSVIYTLSTYRGTASSSAPVLSSNLISVILLAEPLESE